MANPQTIIPRLAYGAIDAQIKQGQTNPTIIEFEAMQDCLLGFVRIMKRQPNGQEIGQITKRVQASIKARQASTPESEREA